MCVGKRLYVCLYRKFGALDRTNIIGLNFAPVILHVGGGKNFAINIPAMRAVFPANYFALHTLTHSTPSRSHNSGISLSTRHWQGALNSANKQQNAPGGKRILFCFGNLSSDSLVQSGKHGEVCAPARSIRNFELHRAPLIRNASSALKPIMLIQ